MFTLNWHDAPILESLFKKRFRNTKIYHNLILHELRYDEIYVHFLSNNLFYYLDIWMKKLYFSKLSKQRTIILWYCTNFTKERCLISLTCTFPDYYRDSFPKKKSQRKLDTRGLKLWLARTMNPKRYHLVLCVSNYHAIQYFRQKLGKDCQRKRL